MREFTDKVAVVTGAASGIGAALARTFAGEGMKVVLVGVALGVLGAAALSQALGSMLYDVSAVDPLAFIGTVAILLVVALLANYIPVRRGARVDPMVALRTE